MHDLVQIEIQRIGCKELDARIGQALGFENRIERDTMLKRGMCSMLNLIEKAKKQVHYSRQCRLRFKLFAFRLFSILLALSALDYTAIAQQYPTNFVAAFKQAQDKRIEADKKLLNKMEDVADWLADFRFKNGHFPEMGLEQDDATTALQAKILLPNPYTSTGVSSTTESAKPCSIRFITDNNLNESRRMAWLNKIPSDWKADPGTITVLYDPHNICVLWGAGADRSPIFDSKKNKYMLSWREIGN